MIRKLNLEDAKVIYKKYMENDFPDDEVPSYNHYIELIENNKSTPYLYEEENEMKAYIICVEKGDFVLISHLAVLKEYRGQGIGTKLLDEMKSFYRDKQAVILEAEAEEQAKDEKALETIKRRQKFYIKCGFIPYPNIDYELTGVKYLIFVYSNLKNEIEAEKLMEVINKLYSGVLKDSKILKMKVK